MAYTKQTWNDRDELSDARLNKIEDGLVEYSQKTDENTDLIDSSGKEYTTIDDLLAFTNTLGSNQVAPVAFSTSLANLLTNNGASSIGKGIVQKRGTDYIDYFMFNTANMFVGRYNNGSVTTVRQFTGTSV